LTPLTPGHIWAAEATSSTGKPAAQAPVIMSGTARQPVRKVARMPPVPPVFLPWLYLVVAGVLEVVWAYTMKQSQGFTRLLPSVITIVTMVASFALLSLSMKSLPLGTAYTIWTGIGAVGAFTVGILVLGESVSIMRIGAAVLIVSGLVLMKLSSPA